MRRAVSTDLTCPCYFPALLFRELFSVVSHSDILNIKPLIYCCCGEDEQYVGMYGKYQPGLQRSHQTGCFSRFNFRPH